MGSASRVGIGVLQAWRGRPSFDYCAPIGVFLLLTAFEPLVPRSFYPAMYSLKIVAVALALAVFKVPLKDIRPSWAVVAPSLLLGLAVFVVWVGLDKFVSYSHLGRRIAFDPTGEIADSAARVIFLAVRFCGLAIVVPVMEELFWRSFLLRYLTATNFLDIPIGTFSRSAFWLVVAAFSIAHPEWLAAAVTAVVYGLWLARTRSLFGTVIAHAMTNGALGAYVLLTGQWAYW
jgi:hypothetical protein